MNPAPTSGIQRSSVVGGSQSTAARHYGEIRAALRASGRTLDAMDLLIAAHARSVAATLITSNVAHLERVPGLKWADWERG